MGLTSATITGNSYVGSLAGRMDDSVSNISNSYSASAAISGAGFVGGLVGWIRGNISSSYSTGTATGTGATGGLSGANQFGQSNISNSYSSMNVSGNAAGGLVGGNDGIISKSYSTGTVTGTYAGGLVGQNHAGTILDSYSTGVITGSVYGGGLVGLAGPNDGFVTTITNSYSTGFIGGSGTKGGLVGLNQNISTITSSFWDTQTSGQANSPGGGTGKTTAEMQTALTYAGWSDAYWNIADGAYPTLKNMPLTVACPGYDNCWTGAIDSLWATAGNWTAGLPGGSQTVKIDVVGTPTISLTGVSPSFGSLWLAENLDVDAGVTFTLGNLFTLNTGTATFDGSASVHSYTQTGGMLAGNGTFTVTNNFVKTGGAIDRFGDLSISQAAGTLNFSATRVESALTLTADTINLGPVAFAGGVNLTTDNLTVSGAVSSSSMSIQPKTYNATTLGRVAASNLSLLQSDLDNLTTGYIYIYGNTMTVDSGSATPVTLANVSDYLYTAVDKLTVSSPLTLSQSGTALYLNPSRLDINAALTVGAGGVFLGRNASNVAYLVGVGSKTYPANTVELTNAELNRIVTTGPVIIGDPYNSTSSGHGPMHVVGTIDLTGITTQLRLVGNGITQAAGATITVPQLAVDGYGSINLPEANHVESLAAKTQSGSIVFANDGPLVIGKVATMASPANFTTTGVVAGGGNTASISANGAMTLSAGAGETVKVSGTSVWLTFNGDLNLNAGAGGQAYVEAELAPTIHLDFSNSAGQVKFKSVVATATTNGLAGPGTPGFIGFWNNGIAAVEGSTLLLANTGFSFGGGGSCPGYDNCWTGAVNSLWATGSNWTAGHAPTGSESAKVDVAGDPTISILGLNPSFGSLWLAENLNVDAGVSFTLGNLFTLSAGIATFDGAASVHGYVQTGGTLAGSGAFTVTNNFAQPGGAINRVGNMEINQASGALNFAAMRVGDLDVYANTINLGPISVDGYIWAAANGDLTVNGPLSAATSSVHLFAGQTGPGTMTLDGNITAYTNTQFVNKGGSIGHAGGEIWAQTGYVEFNNNHPATPTGSYISLGSVKGTGPLHGDYHDEITVTSRGQILDNNGSATNITADIHKKIYLISAQGSPNSSALAISADTATVGSITATVASGANYGGISIRNSGAATPGSINISDTASAGKGIAFFHGGSDLVLNDGSHAFLMDNAGDISITAGSNMTLDGRPFIYIPSSAFTVLLSAAGTMDFVGGAFALPHSKLQLQAASIQLGTGSSIEAKSIVATVSDNITLDNGGHFHAGNDIDLSFSGPASTLSMSNGGYVLANTADTIRLDFMARSSGGVMIDGVETITSLPGGSGLFVLNHSTPALPGAGLEVTYGVANSSAVLDLCAFSPTLCNPPNPGVSPIFIEVNQAPGLGEDKTAKCAEGSFGCEEEQVRDGHRPDRRTHRGRVAQCM
ncbi:MAG: hypothetical protein IPK39_06000 [Sulfuritalea sp.]|nr:hypothetical protein [Sulfuritalea sp.]